MIRDNVDTVLKPVLGTCCVLHKCGSSWVKVVAGHGRHDVVTIAVEICLLEVFRRVRVGSVGQG